MKNEEEPLDGNCGDDFDFISRAVGRKVSDFIKYNSIHVEDVLMCLGY